MRPFLLVIAAGVLAAGCVGHHGSIRLGSGPETHFTNLSCAELRYQLEAAVSERDALLEQDEGVGVGDVLVDLLVSVAVGEAVAAAGADEVEWKERKGADAVAEARRRVSRLEQAVSRNCPSG